MSSLRRHTSRFLTNTLVTGKPEDAARGLTHFIGVRDPFGISENGMNRIAREVQRFVDSVKGLTEAAPDYSYLLQFAQLSSRAPVQELCDTIERDVHAWFNYVLHETTSEREYHNGIRDHNRGAVTLQFFAEHEVARQAELDLPHVFALRFYTTHAYKFMNGPLRSDKYGSGRLPHPMPAMMAYISDAIKKLRAVYIGRDKEVLAKHLWRGMRNVALADSFMEMDQGGTEIAPMSTTNTINVALRYGLSPDSLLFKFKVKNYLQFGAELQWVSAFPAENEVLYPPLTYLEPTGKTQVIGARGSRFTVVEVIPHLP